ncbi:MAG TPA: serine/threonine-protein kinase [Myxococcaceae bacterium]|nr:serine/threonine-protein kinase [Myxococcaceae bacterium]
MSLEGRHLGRYRLLEPLGSGGMSVVYRGVDTSLHREVAVKVLHPHLARQQEARARLAREARAVARLQHPNILEVFDFADPSTEEAFLVTELVRGETLKSFAERERLFPPELAALVIQQLARALGHAHEAGVIHRDLKPENVMVRDDGVLKLMDFGIARVLDPGERMTVTGALVGSPAYMAPEVIDGEPATAESDVFSLGTLLYWLWTGTLPFAAPSTPATLKRILAGTYEDPRGVCPAISDALVTVLDTCLAHDPVDRYASARELEQALSQALDDLGLTDGETILGAFFSDPAATRAALVQRLVAALLSKGAEEAAAGRLPRALARVDQALALEPEAPAARALLDRLQSSLRRGRTRRRAAAIAGGTLVVAALAVGVTAVVRIRAASFRDAEPVAAPGSAVLSAVTAPSRPGPAVAAPVVPASVENPAAPAQDGVLPGAAPTSEGNAESPPRSVRSTSRPAVVRYQVLVRPYGSLQVDDERKSSEALSIHSLALSPGRHVLRVSCQWCEDQVVPIDVVAGKPETLAIPARLKAAELRFSFEPSSAQVRIGEVTRGAGDSLSHPFEIASPRAPTRFVHRVEYQVTAPGYRTVRSSVEVLPGSTRTLTGKLVPE